MRKKALPFLFSSCFFSRKERTKKNMFKSLYFLFLFCERSCCKKLFVVVARDLSFTEREKRKGLSRAFFAPFFPSLLSFHEHASLLAAADVSGGLQNTRNGKKERK